MRTLITLVVLLFLAACYSSGSTTGDARAEDDPSPDPGHDPAPEPTPDEPPTCASHIDCLVDRYCGPCDAYTCPCDTSDPGCRPHCMPNPCPAGTDPICPSPPLPCVEYEVLTVVGGCWACLNLETCRPWGEPGCMTDTDCGPGEYCDPCATGSCPACEDCVADCRPLG